jgi:hypothetical protein
MKQLSFSFGGQYLQNIISTFTVSMAKVLFLKALLISAITIARPCGDHFEFVVQVFRVLEASLAETASSCELAGEAAVICMQEGLHLSPGVLTRQIGPLFSCRGYSNASKIFRSAYFYYYEKSLVVDVLIREATALRKRARRGLMFSAMAMSVYFFQSSESAEGSRG